MMNSGGRRQRRITRNGFDVEPTFAPDGTRIAFARITNDVDGVEALHVVNTDGTSGRTVVPPTPGLEHPDWSPDRRWIAYNIGLENRSHSNAGSVLVVHPERHRPSCAPPSAPASGVLQTAVVSRRQTDPVRMLR
jgi:Tol biopolymer transport system component